VRPNHGSAFSKILIFCALGEDGDVGTTIAIFN